MDAVVVVSAPPDLQRARVLARPGMTQERLDAFSPRQMPDAEKRAQADFVVETDKGLDHAFDQVRRSWRSLARAAPSKGPAQLQNIREIVFDTETTGFDPATATASSRSAASSWWIIFRPGAAIQPTSTRNGTCRWMPARSRPFQRNSSPTSRSSPMSWRNSWNSSATRCWSSTMPAST